MPAKTKNILKLDDVNDPKSFIEKILGDISKTSATKQLAIGASTGWLTGYLAMKIGKAAACAIGGGIIILELANQKGYIKIRWDKFYKQLEKVTDKVEEQVTGEGPSWSDKMERYVDNKLDDAEDYIKKQQSKTKRWFSPTPSYKLQEIHIFLASFFVGVAFGVAIS